MSDEAGTDESLHVVCRFVSWAIWWGVLPFADRVVKMIYLYGGCALSTQPEVKGFGAVASVTHRCPSLQSVQGHSRHPTLQKKPVSVVAHTHQSKSYPTCHGFGTGKRIHTGILRRSISRQRTSSIRNRTMVFSSNQERNRQQFSARKLVQSRLPYNCKPS
jgi:hypothetical protein